MQVLPQFQQFDPAVFKTELTALLDKHRQKTQKIIDDNTATWESLVQPLEDMDNELHQRWSLLSHLHNVMDSELIRDVYNGCLPILSDYQSEMGQNTALCNAFKKIAEHAFSSELTENQRRVIANALRDFHLSGVDLDDSQKTIYRELQKKLSELTTRFEENVLDATDAWFKHITDKNILSGIPEHMLYAAAQQAQQRSLEGWVLTLEFPCYLAVICYADNRELRKEIYQAFYTRASEFGCKELDNSEIMLEILEGRHALAKLLGFNNFAEVSLATKMLKTPEQVLIFLNELAQRALPAAREEYNKLNQFFKTDTSSTQDIEPWDAAYYSEKLLKQLFDFTSEELRPYFSEPKVLSGMFELVSTLYDIKIKPVDNVETWHADVKCFAIYDNKETIRGYFYIDLYARPNKRGGAWMDDYCGRYKKLSGEIQLPIAFLTCNFTAPQAGQPALFSHDEVLTLFHEFGHGLHHLLTQVDELSISGINGVEWDAVELPSQFMENFCWNKTVIKQISSHYQTGMALPDELFDKLLASKNFHAATQLIRQLEFSLFDFRIHKEYAGKNSAFIQNTLNEVNHKIAVMPKAPFNRFQHSFSHIFAGGYAAGYYSYKWAEVLSCDVFAKFVEHGVINASVGQQFLACILERGGSEDAMQLFKYFRGREPEVTALLVDCGLLDV